MAGANSTAYGYVFHTLFLFLSYLHEIYEIKFKFSVDKIFSFIFKLKAAQALSVSRHSFIIQQVNLKKNSNRHQAAASAAR